MMLSAIPPVNQSPIAPNTIQAILALQAAAKQQGGLVPGGMTATPGGAGMNPQDQDPLLGNNPLSPQSVAPALMQ